MYDSQKSCANTVKVLPETTISIVKHTINKIYIETIVDVYELDF